MSQPQTIGRYEILAELGHGAMGAVYKARDPLMDRTVAIKTILSGALSGPMAEEYRERFTREARAAGRLAHPGIVTVYDVGEFNGTPYLVMEFVDGRSLAAAMDSGNRFSFDHIFELGRQIADALGYAHRNGVVHRDIKPANILLSKGAAGEPERAKIADLGVAKLSASQITTTGQLLGTPAFMPPEQFTGATIDGRADLFSLGVILYWLATGDKPFAGDTITAVSYKIVHSSPAPPRRINPAVPAALEQIILKCLEKDPAARYLTGEALAADLAAARAGRMPAAQNAGVSQTATDTVMAPASLMDGDPNTTLDSDARVQMAAKQQAPQAGAPSAAAGKSGTPRSSRGLFVTAAIGVLILAAGITTWRVVQHRRQMHAAEEASAQAAGQLNGQAQTLAQSQGQQSTTAQTTGTPDQTTAPSAQPSGGAKSGNTALVQPSAGGTPSPSPGGGPSGSASTAKKTTPKTPPNRAPSKPPANSGSPASANSAGAAQTVPTPQPQQTQAPAAPPPPAPSASSTNPAPSRTTAPPQPAPAGSAPSAATTENAKLHIDAGRIPLSTSFVVIMDGKVLFQRKALAEHDPDPTRDDLMIPPGDHEIRVVTAQGGIHVGDSNSVRTSFQSKKRMILRIEIRDNSTGQMMKKSSPLEVGKGDFEISVKAANLLGF